MPNYRIRKQYLAAGQNAGSWQPRGLTLLVAAMATDCGKSLPSAPSELLTGVTLYEHANFLGRSAHLTSDVRDLKDFDGPCEHTGSDANGTSTIHDWNDCASSIRAWPQAGAWRPIETTTSGVSPYDCITSVHVIALR